MAQDSPAEEQPLEDHNTEDKTNEELPPPSNTEDEKMYRDADKVESFGAESPILAGRLQALLEDQGSPAFGTSRVQGHRRNFLWIQNPLPTQATSLQNFTQ
jgi:hypothetical protein